MPTTASTARSANQRRRKPTTSRRDDEAPVIPILARKVREVEAKAQRGKLGPTNRVKFQVIAFLVREERARVKADTAITDAARAELLKRLDGVATILAKTAARDTSLIQLLEVDQAASPVARRMRRDWLLESGAELPPDELIITDTAPASAPVVPPALAQRQVIPTQIEARQMAQPVPRPRPERARQQADAPPPARRLGAHGPPLQGVRDGRRRRRGDDGPPGGPRVRPPLAQGPGGHAAPVAVPRGRARGTPHLPPRR